MLREYVEDDAEAFLRLNSDPEVLRYVPDQALVDVDQARQILVDHPISDYRKHGFGRGACILKSTGENIGFAGLKYLEELGEVDVAYRLMPAYWGRGLATEAAIASVQFGFDRLGLKRIAVWLCQRMLLQFGSWKKPDYATPRPLPSGGNSFQNTS